MGESQAAADQRDMIAVMHGYGVDQLFSIKSDAQVDPDTTIFVLETVGGELYYVLETDYVSDVSGVQTLFEDYFSAEHIAGQPKLVPVVSPPDAFDYKPYLKARPEYFSDEHDDYNQLRLFETVWRPHDYSYDLRYFVASSVPAVT